MPLVWEGLPGVVPETRRSAGSAKADTVAVPTLKKLCFCGPPATAHRPPGRTRLNRGPGRSTKSFKNYLISHATCEGGSGINPFINAIDEGVLELLNLEKRQCCERLSKNHNRSSVTAQSYDITLFYDLIQIKLVQRGL